MDKITLTKENVLKQFRSQRAKNYTFISLFFVIFSVFIVFAIRPSLVTAISLNQQLAQLKEVDARYEQVVSHIVANQAELENNRDKLFLINQAMPSRAVINKLVSDIEVEGRADEISFINLNIVEVNLIQTTQGKPESIIISAEAIGTYENLIKFIQGLSKQRRLKAIKQLTITKDIGIASDSSQLRIDMQIEGFYL